MSQPFQRPMSVREANTLREIDLWREHERVANEIAALHRAARTGNTRAGDDMLHRNLLNQLDVIETAIAALECEQGADMSERLQTLVASFHADIEHRIAARDTERARLAVLAQIADALSPEYQRGVA